MTSRYELCSTRNYAPRYYQLRLLINSIAILKQAIVKQTKLHYFDMRTWDTPVINYAYNFGDVACSIKCDNDECTVNDTSTVCNRALNGERACKNIPLARISIHAPREEWKPITSHPARGSTTVHAIWICETSASLCTLSLIIQCTTVQKRARL